MEKIVSLRKHDAPESAPATHMLEEYSTAAGSIDITPQAPIPLAGYATLRKATFERVADPLEANVLILRRGGATVVFIAYDLMYVGAYLQDAIVRALADLVPAEAIFASAVHTHSGPPTEDSLPILGAVTPAYREHVAKRVGDLTRRLLDGPFIPAAVEYFEGLAPYSVNRRKKVFGISRSFPFFGSHVRIAPNLSGPRDDMIRMIRIHDDHGRDVAACWSYACHPVGFPRLDDLSAEYPGVVRAMLRDTLGDIPVVFWQGFSGNIGPLQPAGESTGGTLRTTQYHLRAATLLDWQRWTRSLGQRVIDTARGESWPVRGPLSCGVRELPVRELGLSSGKRLRLQEIRLGNELLICGLSAEVAVEYVEILRQLHSPARVIPVGCVGDVFGYLPVDAMVREGGYEARGFVRRFGLRGRFAPNVSTIVTERLLRCPAASSQPQGGTSEQRGTDVVERGSECPAATRTIDV